MLSVTDFQGQFSDAAHGNNGTTVEEFLSGGRCWAFECLHALYIIWTVYGLLMKTSTYMLTEMLYLRSAEGSVHTSSSATTEEGVSSDFFF